MTGEAFSPTDRVRLEKELILWVTTVRSDGQPQSHPVWYVLDGDDLLVWSKEGARSQNVQQNNRVAAHLNDNGTGGNVLTIEGRATVDSDLGPGSAHHDFVRRYQPLVDRYKTTWEWFDGTYKIPIRIRPQKIRSH